jgi:predicted anti-sigma-YlaC factor YlaD
MKCKQVKLLLSKYMDKETGSKEEKILLYHIKKCPNCREEKERLECVHQLLMPPEAIEPSPQFISRVRKRAAGEQVQGAVLFRSPVFQRLKPALTSLAFLILVAIFFFFGSIIGNKMEAKKTMEKQMISNTLEKTIPLSFFSDVPDGSIASAYYALLKE